MAYTEFYCDPSTGNQMNGGSDAGSPSYTFTNGGWSSVTGVYTPTSGDPSLSVTVGQFAAVFVDGVTTPSFVGRVTAVSSTTVTVSVTVKIGTVPTTAGSGISIRVGGAWLGPNGASAWPVGSVTNALVNSSSNPPRINLLNTGTYSISAGLNQNQSGVTLQGATSAAGDGGKATIDASTNAVIILTVSGTGSIIQSLILSNNGTTGSNAGMSVSASVVKVIDCVVHNVRGSGFTCSSNGPTFVGCEAYACNTSGTSLIGGFDSSQALNCAFCISHDNTTNSNCHGFVFKGVAGGTLLNCIADSNAGAGAKESGGSSPFIINSDFYNNSGAGVDLSAISGTGGLIENCNFVKNTGNGVKGPASGSLPIVVNNCGFGSGTQANAATTSGRTVQELNSVAYASDVTPWVDPANGDFRISLAAAIAAGRGAFTQTQASYTGASGSPVIGACQVADYPTVGNVNSGVTYANAAYTGTLAGGGGSTTYAFGSRQFLGT